MNARLACRIEKDLDCRTMYTEVTRLLSRLVNLRRNRRGGALNSRDVDGLSGPSPTSQWRSPSLWATFARSEKCDRISIVQVYLWIILKHLKIIKERINWWKVFIDSIHEQIINQTFIERTLMKFKEAKFIFLIFNQ